MGAFIAKALLAGVMVAAISELGRRLPAAGAVVASLPLVAILGMIFLWVERPDVSVVARFSYATFWFVLPSLPMFLLIPVLLRHGTGFWLALLLGGALTVTLYFAMIQIAPRLGLDLGFDLGLDP